MMTMGTTMQELTASVMASGELLPGVTRNLKAKPLARGAGNKPVAAHGKNVGNGEAEPRGGNNLAVDGPMLQGNVVDAHPEHHAKAHDKGEQQALSFVDRHKGHGPFCVTPQHHATKMGGQDGAVETSSRPPVIRASATTYVVELP